MVSISPHLSVDFCPGFGMTQDEELNDLFEGDRRYYTYTSLSKIHTACQGPDWVR